MLAKGIFYGREQLEVVEEYGNVDSEEVESLMSRDEHSMVQKLHLEQVSCCVWK